LFENETKILKIKIGVLHLSMLETSNFVLTLNCSEKKRSKILGVSKCISQKAVILPKLISIEENDSLSAHVAGKHTKSGARPSSPIRLAGTLYWHTGLLIRIRVRPSANSPAATQSKVEMRK